MASAQGTSLGPITGKVVTVLGCQTLEGQSSEGQAGRPGHLSGCVLLSNFLGFACLLLS